MNDIDDPSLSGYGDGWAEPCPVCRDPLDEDGSCAYCGTVVCHGCSAVIKHEEAVMVADGGEKPIPLCRPCAASAPEEVPEEASGDQTVRERTAWDPEVSALIRV